MMQNKFVWYELLTTDTTAAADFYAKVVGWRAEQQTMTGMAYTILSMGEHPIGGLMALPEAAKAQGAPPGWMGYIAVDDVDAETKKVQSKGGKVYQPPVDIPNVGRFSVVADPQGAPFYLFKGSNEPPPPYPPMAPGNISWHELHAGDREPAFAFYADMFGWQKSDALDMGPEAGIYQLWSYNGGDAVGGMMTKMPTLPMPFWLYYIGVPDIDVAIETVKANGGTILFGPQEVPGDAWVINALDPQGAMFALVGMRK
ncbi:VOC family protein [Lacibacterium aquatile]|uniref:VOC family protein n=1 Tax=Lacibacterium aquatile TaxID=1168082 RepID=A0ABW5DQ64_9PROT